MEKQNIIFRKGSKVILRPILEEDIASFVVWMNDPEVSQYIALNTPVSFIQEKEWFERSSVPTADKMTLAIVDIATKDLIGTIGMHDIDYKSGTATTGTLIGNKKYWGKGFGTEAKMLLLEFVFNELNLRKIYSDIIGYNARSIAYAKSCGYREEARIPNHYYRKGKYWDKFILAVYRTDWEELWNEFSKTLS